MWFKKKSVLQGEGHYNSNTAVNGTDWRITEKEQTWSASQTLPSAADAGKYFYLPALGYYYNGQLGGVGYLSFYWSSSAYPWNGYGPSAYCLRFNSGNVTVYLRTRWYHGFRVGGFE